MNNYQLATPLRCGGFFTREVAASPLHFLTWFLKKLVRVCAFVIMLAVLIFSIMTAWIAYNDSQTNYSIEEVNGQYEHSTDQMTTDIINWLTGETSVPESIKLPLYRQYVKTVRESAEMEIPSNFLSMNYYELNRLVIEWYDQKYPEATNSREEKIEIINGLFERSVRPPLEGFSPNVNERVWMVMEDVHAPLVRLVGEQDAYASRMIAASASRGDQQAFYYAPEHTIFIRYNDSVKVLLDEAGHAEQFKEAPHRSHWRLFESLVSSFFQGALSEANEYYRQGYRTPTALEGEAHIVRRSRLLERHGLGTVFDTAPEQLAPEHVCVVPNPLNVD